MDSREALNFNQPEDWDDPDGGDDILEENQPDLKIVTPEQPEIEIEDSPEDGELSEADMEAMQARLEELSDPEKLEAAFAERIFEAEAKMEAADGRQEMLAGVVDAGIAVAGEHISTEVMAEAKEMLNEAKGALAKLKSINLKELAGRAATGVQEFLKENMLSMSPLLLGPLAAVSGGDVATATKASVELTAGMIALDKTLDMIMENAEEVLPPQYLVALMAATTNLAEAGASQASAIGGDPLHDVGATPLGSNPTNIYLTGFAMMAALKDRAVADGHVDPGEKVGFKAMVKTLRGIDWKSVKKEVGMAGMMAADAMLFQFLVRPQMKKGNFIPMAAWTVANVPFIIEYFRRTTFSKGAKIKNAMGNVGDAQLEKMRTEIADSMDRGEDGEEPGPMEALLAAVEQYREAEESDDEKQAVSELQSQAQVLRDQFAEDPAFQDKVAEVIDQAEMKDLKNLLEIAGLKFEGDKKKVDKRKVGKMLAGMLAVGGLATVLDSGVTHMADALPYLSKGPAGFVFMSFFSSLGEFQVSKKFFARGQDRDAAKNITDSNAINIGLAKAAMATSFVRKMF